MTAGSAPTVQRAGMDPGTTRNTTGIRWTILLIVVAAIAGSVVVVCLAAIFVLATGSLSVAADEKPDLVERTLAPWGRDRSVHNHAPKMKNPYAGDADAIAAGLDHYRENCLVCHGAPGVPISDLSKGLNPPAPSLGREQSDTPDGELFWVTKHGIRLTSMPAFGWTHSDEEIWKIVAFLRHLPELNAEEKQFLREGALGAAASLEEEPYPEASRPAKSHTKHSAEIRARGERLPQGANGGAAGESGRDRDDHNRQPRP
jgi:mono/diheme cytochrome c family protein